jgi:hypothetical protein
VTNAAPTVFDFEDRPNQPVISRNDYAAKGLILEQGGVIVTPPSTHSPTHALRRATLEVVSEFLVPPYRLRFTSLQSRVKLYAGADSPAGTIPQGTLEAYNSDGSKILQDGPKPVTANAVQTPFEVNASTPTISYVELEINFLADNGTLNQLLEYVDDLEIEGVPPPEVPTSAPLVSITAPSNGALSGPTFLLQGNVTGGALVDNVQVQLWPATPPNRPRLPPETLMLPLTGSGITRNFSGTVTMRVFPDLPHLIIVEARNVAGLTGSAQELVAIVPPEIATRLDAVGAATIGALQWGASGDGCIIEVFTNGAIASNRGTTYLILGDIFTKWLDWLNAKLQSTGAIPTGILCPTQDEQRVDTGGAPVRVQNFRGGRIYAKLPDGSHFVPAVFAQAIDRIPEARGFPISFPISDPKRSVTAKTWLYQQFTEPRTSGPTPLPTTIEIKGDPPVLWVEHHGVITSQLPVGPGEVLPRWSAWAPTIAVRRSCSGREGPCDFTDPYAGQTVLPNPSKVCGGKTYPFAKEWTAIKGDYDLTSAYGLVWESRMSEDDLFLSHSFSWDWNIFFVPLPGSRDVLSDKNPHSLELEWEWYFWHYFTVLYSLPVVGDLMFVAGRWIVDCGHDDFSTEIHPPSLVAFMRTNPTPATDAYIWINGFYDGDPIDVDITPPPRPAPNAFLVVNKPLDTDAAVGIQVAVSGDKDAFSFARAQFSATPRYVTVDDSTGEMIWQGGREYMGHWSTFWQIHDQYSVSTANSSWWP